LKLKKIYEKQAEINRTEVMGYIRELIGSESVITDEGLKVFCENIYNLDYIAYRY
jgi:hypothetical protein